MGRKTRENTQGAIQEADDPRKEKQKYKKNNGRTDRSHFCDTDTPPGGSSGGSLLDVASRRPGAGAV